MNLEAEIRRVVKEMIDNDEIRLEVYTSHESSDCFGNGTGAISGVEAEIYCKLEEEDGEK